MALMQMDGNSKLKVFISSLQDETGDILSPGGGTKIKKGVSQK